MIETVTVALTLQLRCEEIPPDNDIRNSYGSLIETEDLSIIGYIDMWHRINALCIALHAMNGSVFRTHPHAWVLPEAKRKVQSNMTAIDRSMEVRVPL